MDRVEYQSLVIQDIVNLEKKSELNLTPWYQRRSVWTDIQKSYLINTLIEKKPIPAVYIRHSIDLEKGKSIKEVVDGQQRTRAIIEFCNNGFAVKHPLIDRKIKFSELKTSQREEFLLTAIPVGYLLGATDSDVIDIFARINSVAKTLNDQEKRNSQYSGDFKQFTLLHSVSRLEFWRNYKIFSATDISRMNEVQFLSDLVVNMIQGLSDYSAALLNKYYKDFDEKFSKGKTIERRLDKVFNLLLKLNPDSIKETIFKRQPIFFSLFLVLDDLTRHDAKKIEAALFKMDANFNSDIPVEERGKKELDFYNACTSTTQRIKQRQVRQNYISSNLK
ncbi:MAG: DUF262 domain-containing protein [Candidatus Brocadiaceae bacterium]